MSSNFNAAAALKWSKLIEWELWQWFSAYELGVFGFINPWLKRKTELTWGRTADGLNLWRHTKRKHAWQFQGVFWRTNNSEQNISKACISLKANCCHEQTTRNWYGTTETIRRYFSVYLGWAKQDVINAQHRIMTSFEVKKVSCNEIIFKAYCS